MSHSQSTVLTAYSNTCSKQNQSWSAKKRPSTQEPSAKLWVSQRTLQLIALWSPTIWSSLVVKATTLTLWSQSLTTLIIHCLMSSTRRKAWIKSFLFVPSPWNLLSYVIRLSIWRWTFMKYANKKLNKLSHRSMKALTQRRLQRFLITAWRIANGF